MPEWFEYDGELPCSAKEFLTAMRFAAGRWHDADPLDSQVYQWEDRLVLGLDVCDRARNSVLRTLRVDYRPSGLTHGEDETMQFATDLTPVQRQYGHIEHGKHSPANLGQIAADWLRSQMIRPIELMEWRRFSYWCNQYRLADTGRALSWSAEGNHLRTDLGLPDRVSRVLTSCG